MLQRCPFLPFCCLLRTVSAPRLQQLLQHHQHWPGVTELLIKHFINAFYRLPILRRPKLKGFIQLGAAAWGRGKVQQQIRLKAATQRRDGSPSPKRKIQRCSTKLTRTGFHGSSVASARFHARSYHTSTLLLRRVMVSAANRWRPRRHFALCRSMGVLGRARGADSSHTFNSSSTGGLSMKLTSSPAIVRFGHPGPA